MEPTCKFPRRVVVRVREPSAEGLAVSLCFHMKRKNHYWYTVFLDHNGCAEISGEELLRSFFEDSSFFLMDYVDARAAFTGRVSAKVKSTSELEGAVKVFEDFRKYYPYAPGYEKGLRAAAARGQDPNAYYVELEVEVE